MPFTTSIRSRVRTMAIGVALPLVLLAAFTIWADFRAGQELAQQEADLLTQTTAASAAQYLQNAVLLGETLARNPDVAAMDPQRCAAALTPVAEAFPRLVNLALNDADFRLVCSVLPVGDSANLRVADRPWAQEAMRTGRTTVGQPVIGRIVGLPMVPVTVPVTGGPNGEVLGILTMPLDLGDVQQLVQIPLPDETLLTITDTNSVVVARSVDFDAWFGRSLPQPDDPDEVVDLTQASGYNTTTTADGVRSLFAFRRVPGTPWVVWVGIPTAVMYAPARQALYPKLGLVLLGLLVSWFAAYTLGDRVQTSLLRLSDEMAIAEEDPDRMVGEGDLEEVAAVAGRYNRLLLERRESAKAAATTADLHRLVLHATQDAMWDWDLATDTLVGNTRFFELFGAEAPEPGQGTAFWKDRIHPHDATAALRTKREPPRQGQDVWSHEYRILRADGEWSEVLDRGYALRDASGAPFRIVGSIMDVTEERRVRRDIERTKERYESILRNATFGIYVASSDGTILETNPALHRILGLDPDASNLNERSFFADPEEWGDEIQAGLDGSGPREVEWLRPDGARLRVRIFRTLFGNHVEGVATEVIVEDLTERLELELQFRQAQKMEAMGRLAGGVAHDFNNRLTVIRGRAQLLRDDLADQPDMLGSIDAIIDSADRAAQLTRELLAVSRKQIFRPRIISANDAVTRLQPMFDTLLGKSVSVKTQLAEDLPPLSADPGQLDQILVNLVVNARDAIVSGGEVTISTGPRVVTVEESQRTPGLAAGAYVSLSVHDTGTGMPPAVLERVFEPFFTTKPQGQGTGLGLATVYGLVKQNGGWIGLRSQEGVGTTATVLLPASKEEAPVDTPRDDAPPPPGDGSKILVVEDEDAVRAIVQRTLVRLGYEVITANSADAAIGLVDEELATLALVITDIVMPGISGLDLAERLRTRRPGLAVLFMSGYTDQSASLVDDLRGAREFLAKPFTPKELGEKVSKMLKDAAEG